MGGDIQQVVTDAFRVRAFESDFALQNAGGVRIDIPAGDFTIADAYELLPSANTIVPTRSSTTPSRSSTTSNKTSLVCSPNQMRATTRRRTSCHWPAETEEINQVCRAPPNNALLLTSRGGALVVLICYRYGNANRHRN